MEIIRSEGVNRTIKKHLGSSCFNEEEEYSLIAVRISKALRSVRKSVRKHISGYNVLEPYSDYHLSGTAVPDNFSRDLLEHLHRGFKIYT